LEVGRWGDEIIWLITGDGTDTWVGGGAGTCTGTGGLLIRVGSTYGVGGFAMIEARDNGESSIAGGADTDTRLFVGPVGGDRDAEGAGVADVGKERGARFSLFETARGIGTG